MPVKQYASLGGKKRAESLSPERQREIARRATHRRWMKKRQRDRSRRNRRRTMLPYLN